LLSGLIDIFFDYQPTPALIFFSKYFSKTKQEATPNIRLQQAHSIIYFTVDFATIKVK
jgi:hypothetical protein